MANLRLFIYAILFLNLVIPNQAELHDFSWRWISGTSVAYRYSVVGSAGQFSSSYTPGSRASATVTDASARSGNTAYLFGGEGRHAVTPPGGSAQRLGDLWAYRAGGWSDVGEWAWLGGLSAQGDYYSTPTYPAARMYSTSWFVKGSGTSPDKFYLFGGEQLPPTHMGNLNDVWSFDVSSLTWDLLKGSSYYYQWGIFGTKGVSAASNTPPSMYGQVVLTTKIDGTNSLIFGGLAIAWLADVWKYNAGTNEWTWMNGPGTINTNSVAGASGAYSSAYMPGSRQYVTAIDTTHRPGSLIIYAFGGYGYTTTGTTKGKLADMWAYDEAIHQWAYVTGDSVNKDAAAVGSYGTLRSFVPSNHPGSRQQSGGWSDPNSNQLMHMFGGQGYDESSLYGGLNDIWTFNTTSEEWSWTGGDSVRFQYGDFPAAAGSWFATAPTCKIGNHWLFSPFVNHDFGLMYLFGGRTAYNTLWATKGPIVVIGVSPTPSMTGTPTSTPSLSPTSSPSPSASPQTPTPTSTPTVSPTASPSASPTTSPTWDPSVPTPSPTPTPATPSPSPSPTPQSGGGGGSGSGTTGSSTDDTGLIAGAVSGTFVFLLLAGFGSMMVTKRGRKKLSAVFGRKNENAHDDIEMDEVGTGEVRI